MAATRRVQRMDDIARLVTATLPPPPRGDPRAVRLPANGRSVGAACVDEVVALSAEPILGAFRSFPPDTVAVMAARRFVANWLSSQGLVQAWTAVQLTSELAANAVDHPIPSSRC
jgi:hypothetical protein